MLTPDLTETAQFLDLLEPERQFTFQTYGGAKGARSRSVRARIGDIIRVSAMLRILESIAEDLRAEYVSQAAHGLKSEEPHDGGHLC